MARKNAVSIFELDAKILDRMKEAEKLLVTVPDGAQKASVKALNQGIQTAQTAANFKARKVYTIQKAAFRKGMRIKKARMGDLLARLTSKSARRELIDFEVSPATIQRGKKSGQLKVAVKRSGGLKTLPGAFVERGKQDGKLHVLQRAGKERYPIRIKYGPSPSEMLAGEEVLPYVERRAKQMIAKRMETEIDKLLSK